MSAQPDHPLSVVDDLHVGDDIVLDGPRFGFGGGTPEHFDQHALRSIPGYAAGHDRVEQLAAFYARPGCRIVEIGCATGALITRLARRHRGTEAEFIGIDIEPAMIAFAQRRAARVRGRVRFEVADARTWDIPPVSMVVMYYTLQFLPVADRAALLRRVAERIVPGGALVLFEKTRLPSPESQDLCNQMYEGWKLEQNFSPAEIIDKSRSLRGVLDPLTSAQNAALMRRAGLSRPWPIFKDMAFEGVVATRSIEDVD